ncbi:MAG: asparaginase [Pseudomonadota bacterium]
MAMANANPVIAEVTRGSRTESIHRGAFVVVDDAGRVVLASGDVETPVFARSALKLMQALPLIESGAADALDLQGTELAIACASHSSSPAHVATVQNMLAKASLDDEALQCGAHWPVFKLGDAVHMALEGGQPIRAHNNCSGKHAGYLCASAHIGLPTGSYIDAVHPLQREIRALIGDLSGFELEDDVCGGDGCSAPTFALPLLNFAQAMSKLMAGREVGPLRAAAARRLVKASVAHPFYVAGKHRFCTKIMEAGKGMIYAKTGAEGVYLGMLPELGLTITLKCDDGGTRASEVLLAALIARLLPPNDGLARTVGVMAQQAVEDWNGNIVGAVRAILPD